ncbi:MAG: amidohydrolase [Pseudomonadales bacterium]
MFKKITIPVVLLVAVCLIGGCTSHNSANTAAKNAAVTIYANGDIITMNDTQPSAEAIAVQDGKVVLVGNLNDIRQRVGEAATNIDLNGKTLLPGFIDSHSHVAMTAAKLAVVNTDPPPAGPADSINSIQRVLRERLASSPPAPGEWLVGWGYDNAMLAEGRHPTRADLDAVSTEVPILLIHFSTHQVVVNRKGLALAGISAQTPDPQGGRILRLPNSREPNGILQENAMYAVAFPVLDALLVGDADVAAGEAPTEQALQRVDNALREYAAQGFTTVTEMGATPQSMALLQEMAKQDRLPLDVTAVALSKVYTAEQLKSLYSRVYRNRFRVGGAKIILDGGSPGRSAWLREPYYKQLAGEADYRGYPHIAKQAELDGLVESNYRAANPVYIHALGDAAVDQALTAIKTAQTAVPGEGRRTQLIHVQQVQEDQFDALANLDVTLTFQVAHNFYFGDYHRDVIYGPQRTVRLNPMQSALDRGLSVTVHHDSPVHPIDQLTLIWAAVNRVTRSGQVIGAEQKISVVDALKASTINAAYQFFEEDAKGSIEAGKLADFVILSDNPLKIDPMQLNQIQVLETIKEGKSIFRRVND